MGRKMAGKGGEVGGLGGGKRPKKGNGVKENNRQTEGWRKTRL